MRQQLGAFKRLECRNDKDEPLRLRFRTLGWTQCSSKGPAEAGEQRYQ